MSYITFDVESSAVESMAYNTDVEELIVVYTGGGEYHYMDVPFSVATAAADAESVGQYVNQNIKGVYESYDPRKWMPAEKIQALVREADKLNEKLCEELEDVDESDPVRPAITAFLDALDGYANHLDNVLSRK